MSAGAEAAVRAALVAALESDAILVAGLNGVFAGPAVKPRRRSPRSASCSASTGASRIAPDANCVWR